MLRRISLLWLLLLSTIQAGFAQKTFYNWCFGRFGYVSFDGPVPRAVPGSRPFYLPYSATSVSSPTGKLQFVSDGAQAWDTTGTLLPGFPTPRCTYFYLDQKHLAVPQPGQPGRYYVIRTDCVPVPNGGHSTSAYFVVDMQQRGGLGAVVEAQSMPGILVNEYTHVNAWVAVRHANGRDLWVVTQNWLRQYFAWLLTPTGWAGPPVVSGRPQPGGHNFSRYRLLKASSDGRLLAHTNSVESPFPSTQSYSTLTVARFSPATGIVVQPGAVIDSVSSRTTAAGITLLNVSHNNSCEFGGLEFSPDGSRLYADTIGGREVWQYDLLAGNARSIASSRQIIPVIPPGPNVRDGKGLNALQLGPDGNIYVSVFDSNFLGQLSNVNARAPAVGYRANAVDLGPRQCLLTLPVATNDQELPPVVISGPGTPTAVAGCAGEALQFQTSLSPFITASAYEWHFDDPVSGAANVAAGQAPVHTFQQGGTYQVSLRVTNAAGQQFFSQLTVAVKPRPLVSLGSDSLLCSGSSRLLDPGTQPGGTSYRWQDGSTLPYFTATTAGYYQVEVSNSLGCKTMAAIRLRVADCANLPNIITPNGDLLNQTFVLRGLNAPDWSIRLFSRWGREVFQQTSYDNAWAAQGLPDGPYYYLLTNAKTGQQYKGWVEVRR